MAPFGQEDPPALRCNQRESPIHLEATITAERAKDITHQALGMYTDQHRIGGAWTTVQQTDRAAGQLNYSARKYLVRKNLIDG